MKNFIAHFTVKDGKPLWKNENYFKLNFPKYEGLNGILEIRKKWSKRSLSQNSLYWLWLNEISKYTGHAEEELHVVFRGLFAPKKAIKVGSKTYNIPKSTTELGKGEFVEYMMRIEAEAGTMGIVLPKPEDLDNAVLKSQEGI